VIGDQMLSYILRKIDLLEWIELIFRRMTERYPMSPAGHDEQIPVRGFEAAYDPVYDGSGHKAIRSQLSSGNRNNAPLRFEQPVLAGHVGGFSSRDVDQRPNAGVAANKISHLYSRFRERPIYRIEDVVHIGAPGPHVIRSFPVVGIGRPDHDALVPGYDKEKTAIPNRRNEDHMLEVQPGAGEDDVHALCRADF